jgi:hypothetical protein
MRRLRWRSGAVCALAGLLAACVVDDHRVELARESLQQIEADPDVKAYAPDALADAQHAVETAESLRNSPSEGPTAGFVAQIKVRIAAYRALANRDRAATEQLLARRDALRPGAGQDGLTTLATDALDATPTHLQLEPLTGASPATPSTAPPPKPASEAVAPPPKVPATAATTAPHPLLALAASAFDGGVSLKPGARAALDRLVPILAQQVQRPVMICFGGISDSGLMRASAVRDYLVSRGVARQRLFVALTRNVSGLPAGGISIDFE